jgi:hypothetical protein
VKWNQGSERIEQLLADGRLQQVPASRDHADFLVGQARRHAAAAAAIATIDPAGAYQLSYDAARKALTAVLENQGLRPTQSGGHVVVYDAVRAQLVPPFGSTIAPFNRMRRARKSTS